MILWSCLPASIMVIRPMVRAWMRVRGTTVSWHRHEHVERIVVFGERLRNEAVVRGIVDGGIEDAVEVDQAAGFVEFVLDAGAEGNLDDAVEFLRQLVAGSHVVPGMDHRKKFSTFVGLDECFILADAVRFDRAFVWTGNRRACGILILIVLARRVRVWGASPVGHSHVEYSEDLSEVRRSIGGDYPAARLPGLYRRAGQQELLRDDQRTSRHGQWGVYKTLAGCRQRAGGVDQAHRDACAVRARGAGSEYCRSTIPAPRRRPILSRTTRRLWPMGASDTMECSMPSNFRRSAHRSTLRSSRVLRRTERARRNHQRI